MMTPEEWFRIQDMLDASGTMPDGEPTDEMIAAGMNAVSGYIKPDTVAAIWRAMWRVAADKGGQP